MKKVIIFNDSKSVKVLKAMGEKTLRLFPGHNDVGQFNGKNYDCQAVRGLFDEQTGCLSFYNPDKMTHKQKNEAKVSKEKNEALNKASLTIKQNSVVKKADDKLIKKQADTIETQAKLIADLTERMDAIDKLVDDEKEKTSKPDAVKKEGK